MSALSRDSFTGTSRFEIIRSLGAGGMGVVYSALDRERNVKVALKTLRSLSADAILRFKNEFREFQNLHHPNLVTLGELFFDAGEWFFTMELVEGRPFLSYVRSRGTPEGSTETIAEPSADPYASLPPAPPETADSERLRSCLSQLALALNALHDSGRVHRDIKSSNVIVTAAGRLVLLDYGLATTFAQRGGQSEADIVGTVEYMAPEQAAGRAVGPEADWYAVGVMLFEALTGRVPFMGPALEVLMNKQRHEAPSPRDLNPHAPPDLSSLCNELLRFHPGHRPTGREVLRRLGNRAEAAPPSRSSIAASSLFVGREAELQALRGLFESARRGPVTVAVHGESGVGKSALVRHFTEELQGRHPDAVILAGTCYEAASVPYKAVDGVIDALSAFMRRIPKVEGAALLPRRAWLLTQVFPVLRRVEAVAEAPHMLLPVLDPRELRSQLFTALRELFTRLTDRRPVVLVIDDLQWADSDSLALLGELLREPDAPPMLLIATVRTSGEEPALPLELPGMAQLPVGRLPLKEASELAALLLRRAVAGSGQGSRPQEIAREAGGHPLFIDELVRHAGTRDSTRESPLQLEEALWARITSLEPEARRVLEIVSLASGRTAQQIAAEAVGIPFGEFAKHVALLRVAHLLRTKGMRATDLVEPYHGRVRAAVQAHLSADDIRAHHRRLALAFETSGSSDLEALCSHWEAAGDGERAAHYAARAAEKASQALAFDRAVWFYELCVALTPEPPRAIRVGLAEALANAGRGGEAGRAFLEAAEDAPPGEFLDLRRKAAEQLLRSGHMDEGLVAIGSVLEAVGMKMPVTPQSAVLSLVWRRALVRSRGLSFKERDGSQLSHKTAARIDICAAVSAGLAIVDTIRGADFQARSLLLSLAAGEPSRVVRALAMEVAFNSVAGVKAAPRSRRLLDKANEVATKLQDPIATGMTTWAAGMAAFLEGRWLDGHRLHGEAEAIFRERCTGAMWEQDTSRFIGLWASFYRGDLPDLRRRVPLLRRESESRGDLYGITNLRTAFTPVLALSYDNVAVARVEANEALERWSRSGFHIQHMNGHLAVVQSDLYEEKGADAVAHLAGIWKDLERSMLLTVQQIRARAVHLRGIASLAAGNRDDAARFARKLEREKADWIGALALSLRAGIARRGENPGEAARLYREAAEAFERADMAMYAAAARCRGAGLAAAGQDQAASNGEAWMRAQGVLRPDRFSNFLVP